MAAFVVPLVERRAAVVDDAFFKIRVRVGFEILYEPLQLRQVAKCKLWQRTG